jgi:hypothetical protein
MVDIAKLAELAEEFKTRAGAQKLVVEGVPESDPRRGDEIQQFLLLARWEKIIRDAIATP